MPFFPQSPGAQLHWTLSPSHSSLMDGVDPTLTKPLGLNEGSAANSHRLPKYPSIRAGLWGVEPGLDRADLECPLTFTLSKDSGHSSVRKRARL